MRHYKAAFLLLARSSIYRLLSVFLLLAVVQIGTFSFALNGLMALNAPGLETAIDNAKLTWSFGIGAILVFIILAAAGCEFGSKQGYTLKRLPISEKAFFFCQSAYNCVAFFLFWAVELLITFILCQLYRMAVDASHLSNQTIMLAYYRSDLLHAVLPLADVRLWIRNGIVILSLGIITAAVPYYQRKGRGLDMGQAWSTVIPVAGFYFIAANFFVASPHALTLSLFLLLYAVGLIIMVLRREEDEE